MSNHQRNPPPAPPAPPAEKAPGCEALDKATYDEKQDLARKATSIQQDAAGKNKWWQFCKAHGNGVTEASRQDMAFLMTFIEAYEAGTILEEVHDAPAAAAAGAWGASAGGDWGASAGGASAGSAEGASQPGKIFVGGLPRGTQDNTLWTYFGQWGAVDKVDCKKDESGEPKGFAFITFVDPAIAAQVIANYDNNKMDGKWIDCKVATGAQKGGGKDAGGKGKDAGKGGGGGGASGGAPTGDDRKVFIGGLPRTATEQTVSAFFGYYGPVDRVELKNDAEGSFRGFGFVHFVSAESGSKLLASPHIQFEGKWIECKASATGMKGGKGDGKGDSKGGGDKGGSAGGSWSSGGDWGSSAPSGGGGNDWKSSQGGGGGGGWQEKDSGSAWSSGGGEAKKWESSGGDDKWSSGGGGSGGYGAAAPPPPPAGGGWGSAPY